MAPDQDFFSFWLDKTTQSFIDGSECDIEAFTSQYPWPDIVAFCLEALLDHRRPPLSSTHTPMGRRFHENYPKYLTACSDGRGLYSQSGYASAMRRMSGWDANLLLAAVQKGGFEFSKELENFIEELFTSSAIAMPSSTVAFLQNSLVRNHPRAQRMARAYIEQYVSRPTHFPTEDLTRCFTVIPALMLPFLEPGHPDHRRMNVLPLKHIIEFLSPNDVTNWPTLLVSPFSPISNWALLHAPRLSTKDLAHAAAHGSPKVRQWVFSQLPSTRAP